MVLCCRSLQPAAWNPTVTAPVACILSATLPIVAFTRILSCTLKNPIDHHAIGWSNLMSKMCQVHTTARKQRTNLWIGQASALAIKLPAMVIASQVAILNASF